MPTSRPARAILLAAALAGLLALAAGCTSQARPVKLGSLRWIITKQNLERLHAVAPELAGQLLASDGPVVVGAAPAGQPAAGGEPAALFKSYAQFAADLRDRLIPPGVRQVIYDPESWPATPAAEQHDPVRFLGQFAAVAREHGLTAILAPGRDLTLVAGGTCQKRPGERVSDAYVRCEIPAAARFAPVFVIQAAPEELNLPALTRLVQASARQARRANPRVVLLATISTAPGGVPAEPAAIAAAARTMLPYVQGFMLNMTKPTAGAGAAFLRALATG